jgi:hypothetical protein
MDVKPDRTHTLTTSGSMPLVRGLAWLVLALMAVATLYTGWIALANFHRIGV